jgi:hypothetical protein
MVKSRIQAISRLLMAIVALGGIGFGVATAPVDAAGLRNCTELGADFARSGCWEDVWAGGAEYRMTFATGCCTSFKGKVPDDLDAFYVMAPQDDTPQSIDASFRHDHVLRDIPAGNRGTYSVRLRGYFVICSASGIASGACAFEMNSPGPGLTLPFAKTVNGQALTAVAPLEAAVGSGLLTLVDTGAAIVGSINQNK